MTTEILHPPPARAVVAREQLRATGLALRPAAAVIALFLALFTAVFLWSWWQAMREGGGRMAFGVSSGLYVPAALLGLVVPLGVWKSEDPSRRTYLWSLPVDRGRHQLSKSAAGWLWFMAAVAAYLAWAVALALVTGGDVRASHEVATLTGTVPEDVRLIRTAAPAWQWAVPFVAATVTYLAGSIPALGSQQPWRWIAGLVIGYLLVAVLLNAAQLHPAAELWQSLLDGRWSLRTLFTGETKGGAEFSVPSGVKASGIYTRADLHAWLTAVALWGGAAAAGAAVAIRRFREP